MNIRLFFARVIQSVAIAAVLLLPVGARAADVILYPGYINGTVGVGTGTVASVSINAYGGGYSASKTAYGKDYSMTVQGGDWNYSVSASAQVLTGASYYPYTYISFSNRSFPVHIGETVTNNYSAGAAVRFHLSITGDPYSSWSAYTYAYRAASDGNEQTNSYGYNYSYYSPDNTWVMPVVPNNQIRIYVYVYVDNKVYYLWTDASSYLYKDIAAGQTEDVYMNVVHVKDYSEYGSVRGNVNLDLPEPAAFYMHVVSGYNSAYIYTNPGSFDIQNVKMGTWGYRMYSYFDNYRTYLQWPNGTGYRVANVEKGQAAFLGDFNDSTGVLTGKIRFSGTLQNNTINYSQLSAYGAYNIYTPGEGWISQPTAGAYAYSYKYSSDASDSYRLFLTGGYWNPYYSYLSGYDYNSGYYHSYSVQAYDYNYYYDGSWYNFGQPAIITPGQTTVQDREICFGSVTVRFRDSTDATMSNPRVSGSGVHYNAGNKQDRYVYVNANHYIPNAAAPEVEVHGTADTYSLSPSATAQDGSTITFAPISIALECGVRKCRDSKAPSITITSPAPELITNVLTVTVTGTTTDEYGIKGVTVNGNPAEWWHTGNPNAPHEVAFRYELALQPGRNHIRTFVENTECNSCFDERNVYVDRWMPTVTIGEPGNGDIYTPNGPTVPVSVNAADQGYGYTLTVYLDGTKIGQPSGPADENAPAAVSFNGSIGPLVEGSHTITAVAVDGAGNRAEATVTIVSNRQPTADAGPDQTVECASPNGTAVILNGSGSSDPDGDALTYAWTWQGGSATGVNPTVTLPYGTTLITLTVDDGKGGTATDTVSISVMDTTAPSLSVTVTPVMLWPPNHKYVNVSPSITVQDACVESPRIELVSVISNEPDNGLGDGDTANDIVINVDGTVSLRAERSGTGMGRIYTVTYTATDAAGNSTTATAAVTVPHNR